MKLFRYYAPIELSRNKIAANEGPKHTDQDIFNLRTAGRRVHHTGAEPARQSADGAPDINVDTFPQGSELERFDTDRFRTVEGKILKFPLCAHPAPHNRRAVSTPLT